MRKKILVIGLGSMGKRRIRNLLHNRIPTRWIAGFDLSAERRQEVTTLHSILTFASFQDAIDNWQPKILIISTPPHLHAEYFLYAAKHNLHFFVEVSSTDHGYAELLPLLSTMTSVAAPSFNMSYFYPIKKIKTLIEADTIGQVWAFTHHMGQYLPDWHPWEDYRKFYVSKKESSACREMVPFELGWIQWALKQNIVEAKGIIGKTSDLDMKTEDTYGAVLRSKSGVIGTLLVDVVSRAPFRTFRVMGSKGVLEWHWIDRIIQVYSARTKKWKTITLPEGKKIKGYLTTTEEMYEQEMRAFLHAVDGKHPYPHSFAEDWKNLKLLDMIEKN